MSINWNNLRLWNGSQHLAFEQLCCQLAAYEKPTQDSVFIRKGAPDAGVECFWKLPNDTEWGWQAKFFSSSPDSNQWSQLDNSVKKALEKHPELTLYTICLPVDRSDARINGQKSFMDKWNEREEKWKGWAREQNRSVEFKYWGEHEIFERLSREEHRGRCFFWFNKELLTNEWFKTRIDEAISNVGPRYTPELDIDLPVADFFNGLGRSEAFFEKLKVLYHKIRKIRLEFPSEKIPDSIKKTLKLVNEYVKQILVLMQSADEIRISPVDFNSIRELASKSMDLVEGCIRDLRNASLKVEREQAQEKKSYSGLEQFEYEQHRLHELIRYLDTLALFAQGNEAKLANMPALLIVGNAGIGKTHLFCDVAEQRTKSNLPTLLLLGQHFVDGEPWTQIIQDLGLGCSREEFLGALDAAAQACSSRALILIDALNEGMGRSLWSKYLAGMLRTLERYPWIGIALSVRTSYESMVIPEGLVPDKLIREVHYGFAEHEYQATRTFFTHYGIEQPTVPLLSPEFQNPLFLKLFCKGLENRGLSKIPTGLQGITAVFNFFVESVNQKLARPEYLDFDSKSRVVQEAVEKLANIMADEGSVWLPRDLAQTAVNSFLLRNGYENSLFRHLISEGLLFEDRFRMKVNEWCEGIHFSYERFTDHLVAAHLLDKYLDPQSPSDAFELDQPLGSFIKHERSCLINRGIIDAFSIQLPERIKQELVDIVPTCSDFEPVRESFIESIIWRDYKAFTKATLRYVNTHIIRYEDAHARFRNALLTVASIPEHPYNAEFLHRHLIRQELVERDVNWSIFLHGEYGEHRSVDRLIDWAWSSEEKNQIKDDSIRLCAIALVWFLTTSDRFLRDRSTKALVNLLTKRIHILKQVIEKFLEVNDPYVLERLFAVAYGCTMRSTEKNAIGELAKNIYNWVFKNGMPSPHILLRDYARGVIERALNLGIPLDINIKKIRPPYKSELPSNIPTEEELKKYCETWEGMPDEEWARYHLYQSVMGSDDFARYIIGTNTGHFEWSSRRLSEPKKPSKKEIYNKFIDSLTSKQKKAFDNYQLTITNAAFYLTLDPSKRIEIFKREFTDKELNNAIAYFEHIFQKTLGKEKLRLFRGDIIPYLGDPNFYKDEHVFDLSIAQRWILGKVMDLGWSVKRFGRFDRNVSRYWYYGRSSHKPERIGKKYQWIAYHEFLARVSDNFEFKGDVLYNKEKKYEGPWQMYIRDIDPSCLLRKTEREEWKPHTSTWWFPTSYKDWDSEPDDIEWLQKSDDLPAIEPLIEVINPEDSSRWLNMEAYFKWEQPIPLGEERSEIPRREIWYMIMSYIVRKSDIDDLFDWAKKQNFMGRWMPESHELSDVFLGELFWAPAFRYINIPYYHHEGWTRGHDNKLPKDVLVSSEQYRCSSDGYDCSIDETIRIYLPTKWLSEKLGLRWNGIEGNLYDKRGNLIAFDPSVRSSGPGTLLINRNALLKFLNENGYDILWILLGEKGVIGGSLSRDDWKGLLELSGAYRILKDKVYGILNRRFLSK